MTHEELLIWANNGIESALYLHDENAWKALYSIINLHKPSKDVLIVNKPTCDECGRIGVAIAYPCPTIQAIEKELK